MSLPSIARLTALSLLWGSSFLWIKIALRGFTPVQITLARLLLGAAVLMSVVLLRRLTIIRDLRTWGHLAVAALIANAVPYFLFGFGEQTVGSNVAGFLNASTPLWTILVAFTVGTDRTMTLRRGTGVLLGFIGTVLILNPWAGISALWGIHLAGVQYVHDVRFT